MRGARGEDLLAMIELADGHHIVLCPVLHCTAKAKGVGGENATKKVDKLHDTTVKKCMDWRTLARESHVGMGMMKGWRDSGRSSARTSGCRRGIRRTLPRTRRRERCLACFCRSSCALSTNALQEPFSSPDTLKDSPRSTPPS